MPITIRPTIDADREFIRNLCVQVFTKYGREYPKEIADNRYHRANHFYTLAENETGPMGFALLEITPGVETADLHAIAVDAEHQRSGIGQILLAAVEDQAHAHGARLLKLVVADVNSSGHNFFRQAGFLEKEGLERHFPNGQRALYMEKPLAKPPYQPQ
jgi:ribosomal protein S18 acetylase RimI-like enzyme